MIDLEYAEVYDNLGKYGNLRLNYLHKQKSQQYRELLNRFALITPF